VSLVVFLAHNPKHFTSLRIVKTLILLGFLQTLEIGVVGRPIIILAANQIANDLRVLGPMPRIPFANGPLRASFGKGENLADVSSQVGPSAIVPDSTEHGLLCRLFWGEDDSLYPAESRFGHRRFFLPHSRPFVDTWWKQRKNVP
jgi:hypothetical protein